MNEKFQVLFLEDAAEFLDKLEEKAREKIYYNIQKARFSNDKELFKKLNGEIWEFRTLYSTVKLIIDCLRFGIKPNKLKPLLFQHMG